MDYALASYYNDSLSKKQIIITKIRRWVQHHKGIEWDNMQGTQSYAVQRSTDGLHWITIDRQAAESGQQFATNHYSDPTPSSTSTNYYRLQTTSTSNAVANSNVIATSNDDIKISPNPVISSLQIQGLSAAQKTKLTIIDLNGQYATTGCC